MHCMKLRDNDMFESLKKISFVRSLARSLAREC